MSPLEELQLQYWTNFVALIKDAGSPLRPRKPRPIYELNCRLDSPHFLLRATIHTRPTCITADFRIVVRDYANAKAYFDLLRARKAEIEAELSEKLEWRRMPDNIESNMVLRNPNFDPQVQSTWPQQHAWLKAKLEDFLRVLSPRALALDPGNYDPK